MTPKSKGGCPPSAVRRGRHLHRGGGRTAVVGEGLTRELVREVYEAECETYRNPVTGRLAIACLDAYNRPLDGRSQSGCEGVPQVRR
ncbi:hypothetical protein [Streptomyces sp. TE33382]